MAGDKFIPVSIDVDTLETSPELIQVRNAGAFTPEELAYWDGISKLTNLNTFLSTDPDQKIAKDNFARLSPEIQTALIKLNPEAEYAIPNRSAIAEALDLSNSWLGSFFKSPLRSLVKAASGYIGAIENTALNVVNAVDKVRQIGSDAVAGSNAMEKVTSKDFWTTGWNGYNKWNQEAIQQLDTEYNVATGTLARGLIDGKNIFEIIREYGAVDQDMADAFAMSGTKQFEQIVSRYKRHKINLGTKVTDWAGKFAPYKETPTNGDLIRETFASAVLSLGGARGVKRNKYGEFVTEKIFGKGYGDPSVGLDIAITLFADPLTYMTLGGSRGLAASKSIRTAEELQKAVDGAAKIKKVQDLFQDAQFIEKSQSFLNDLNNYRNAMNTGKATAAGQARLKIALDHPEYDDDVLLGLLTTTTVKKNGEEVLVTDMDTWFRFFESGENLNYLVNGKVNNILTFREEAVALQNRQRRFVNGLRSYAAKVFQGLDREVVIGAKPMPDELVRTWEDVEKTILSRPVLVDAATPEEMLVQIAKNEEILSSLAKPKTYLKKDITRAFGELLARMPAERIQIFWADALVDKSLDALRSYARLVTGDRLKAEFVVQQYKMGTKADRINILYNLDKLYLDASGAAFTPQGTALRDGILQSRYINTERASIANYTDEVPDVFKVVEDVEVLPPGPSAFMHTTEGITVMPFDTVLRDIYDNLGGGLKGAVKAAEFKYGKGYKNIVKKLGYMYYSGSTNSAVSRGLNRGIVFMLLIPKLGIKAAVDEATVLANVSSPRMLMDLLYGKGRQLTNIHIAITADNSAQGPVKELFLNLVGKNPAKFKSAAERKELSSMKEVEVEFRDPDTGKIVKQKEFITAEEYFGMPPEEVLVRDAVQKYGTKLSNQEKSWLIDYYMLTGDSAADAMIGSIIGATYGDSMALGTRLARELYGKSELTIALEKSGRKVLSKPYLVKLEQLNESERVLAHFKYFFMLFGANEKYGVSLPELFFGMNALRTEKDVNNFVRYAMTSFGWNPYKPNPELATKLNDNFGQASILRAAGKTEEEISKIIIVNAAKEMRYVFHGGTEFNEDLWKLITDKVWAAKEKAYKSQYYAEQRTIAREQAGVKEPFSTAEAIRRQKYYDKSIKWKTAIGKITLEEFDEATKNFRLKGKDIKTDIDFPAIAALDPNQPGAIDKIMLKGWSWMDRQVNDVVRSDVFRLRMLEERSKLQGNEELLVKHLMDEGATFENATIQAAGMMANQAMHNAADTVLKYVDNPQLKSQLAFNMRVMGRFMRATEDFYKRTLRWMLRHPTSVPYRIGHVGHAADGSGIVYDDPDGNKYVVIPNDGVFWENVAPAIVMLSNPLYSVPMTARSIKDGNWGFFKQAEWNQYTMKVSLLNPSYSEDAGMYTFVGPNMAIPVAGIRDLLVGIATKTESPNLYNFGLSLDNILLGQVSDNTNILRATVPPALINYFKALTGDYKDNQGVIAAYQAISYLQYNEETAKRPEDFLNKEGVYDPSKAQKFLNEWRIQTANVLAQKAAFNTIYGAPLQLGAPDIPSYLRANGVVTLTQEYGDILRAILRFNQENGFPIADPYTTAVSLHAAQRPGKLIFQVPKNLKETKIAVNYTKETLTWSIKNRKFLENFSSAGWVFAPNIGEYDPKVINYMEAADLIPPDKNPFDWNNKMLKQYIERTSVAKLLAEYYEYDREVARLLGDPDNPNRNFVDYREEVKANARNQQEALLNSNPLLAQVFGRRDFETTEELRANFNELRTIVTENYFPEGTTSTTKKLLKQLVRSTSELLTVAESGIVGGQYLGDTELEQQVSAIYSDYESIASQNAVLGEAWSGIIKPLLDKVYDVPFRVVRKPGD